MSVTVIYLGGQPRTPCQRCARFERDAHGKCYCAQLACPVGLLHRRMRQRTWPTRAEAATPRRGGADAEGT